MEHDAANEMYYTLQNAMRHLGVAQITMYRWIKTGIIRAEKFGPRLWRIPVSEVNRLRKPIEAQE